MPRRDWSTVRVISTVRTSWAPARTLSPPRKTPRATILGNPLGDCPRTTRGWTSQRRTDRFLFAFFHKAALSSPHLHSFIPFLEITFSFNLLSRYDLRSYTSRPSLRSENIEKIWIKNTEKKVRVRGHFFSNACFRVLKEKKSLQSAECRGYWQI